MSKISNSSYIALSDDEDEMERIPKAEPEQDFPSGNMYLHQTGDNVASSSGTSLRSSFISMGFSPNLIDKVIKAKGEDDIDLLLETLIDLSAHQQSNSESSAKVRQMPKSTSSDSLDSLFDDAKDEELLPGAANVLPKQEPIYLDETDDDKRSSLLAMNFSLKEVEFAIDMLGKEAPIDELVDFITAAQMAKSENVDLTSFNDREKNEDNNPENLFGTMDRTLRLLELGFSEHDVSAAIENFGPEVPVAELADWICAGKPGKVKEISSLYPLEIKTEDDCPDYGHQTGGVILEGTYGEKLPKEEYDDSSSTMRDFDPIDIKGKRVKEEYDDSFSAASTGYSSKKSKRDNTSSYAEFGMPTMSAHPSSRSLHKMVAGPPFFLFGNVVNLSNDSWNKMSQFLYGLEPEFANSQFFSAISRKEGYLHNLPTDDRFLVEPRSPMTIEEAIPHTRKWWPSWDTRKQLSCISTETTGITQICDSLRKMMVESRGLLSAEQQTKVLYHCKTLNLIWVGQYKLALMEPEYLEKILGYPIQHTKIPEIRLPEQLEVLRNCFQIDTLGYCLSPLKCFFPGGLTMLSIYGGVGGAEIALDRLGIRLRGVVSVESSEAKRKILKRWWESSGQTGELVQLEDVQKLSSSKLEYLMKKFGGFDLVIGQNPCAYIPRTSKVMGKASDVVGLDFTLYFEFVRVLQRVRSMMGRN